MKFLKLYLSLLVSVCFAFTGFAQLEVTEETDANNLADVLVGDNEGLTIDNAVLIGAEGSAGTFSMGEIGIETGILLTSGSVENAVGPNTSPGISSGNGTPGDPDLDELSAPFSTNDATILEITFTPVLGEALEFSYVFGSDEYNEFVCSSFNDPFGFFINGGVYEDENIALIPDTDIPVTINNVNNGSVGSSGSADNCTEDQLANSEFFFDNTVEEDNPVFQNCEYDGLTVVLSVSIPVEVGVQYTIRLAIADAGDSALDSGVFIEGGSFDVIDFDCDELQANFGDPCELEDGGEGVIDMECECVAPCTASEAEIAFAGGGSSEEVCAFDGEPSFVDVEAVVPPSEGNSSLWVVTDLDANVLAGGTEAEIELIDWDEVEANLGLGNYLIWLLDYDAENSNVPELLDNIEQGIPVNAGDLEGCFALSNSIEVIASECIPSDCENYEYYLADILEDGTTNIYEVSLSGSDAALSLVATSEYEVHIALNEENGLLYAVSKLDGSFRTLDPSTGVFGPVEMLDTEVSEIIGATFNADGKLLISSQSENAIYSVMLGSNAVSVFDSYSPILGGDIDFGSDGTLYLATREGFGTFYMAIPDEISADILVGDAPQLVTGVADTEAENLIFSHRDATTLMVREYDGTPGTPYDITLGGETFMTSNGDLASGCADNRQTSEECEQVIYYTNEPPGADGYTLYATELNGDGTATNTALVSDLDNAHVGVSSDGSTVYIVGNDLRIYDTDLGTVSAPIAITEGGETISSFPACLVAEVDGEDVLYIGGNGDNIYTVDPTTGEATLVTSAYDVQGGDLVQSPDGEIWIITRNNGAFTRISDGLSFTVPGLSINGAAFLENGNVLVADGDGDGDDALVEINISTLVVEATYDVEFDVNNGDLAATCISPEVLNPPCNYELYYVHAPQGGGTELLAVTLNDDGTTSNASLMMNPPNAHIGLTPDGSTLYMVGNGNVNTFDIESATVTNTASIQTADGSGLSGFPAAVVGEDGTLYAGNSNTNQVYTIDPVSGLATPFGPPVDVNGGDLIFAPTGEDGADELWVITRNNNTFTRVSDGTSFTVDVTEINGAAVLENGNVLLADGNGEGLFKEVDLSDQSVVAEYETGLALFNGDLAGGCTSGDSQGDDEAAFVAQESSNTLSSFPNPTNGPSTAVFVTGQTERATLEVYDMNGRLVEGLFSGIAEEGVEYRIDFDGLDLPNGVYMYRLTTDSETVIQKFMVAR